MKQYVKPELYYENFELSAHIAACAWDMKDFKDVDECSAVSDDDNLLGYPGGMRLFNNEEVCLDGPIDDYCYTNGESGLNIFNS